DDESIFTTHTEPLSYQFTETGERQICLVAINEKGCVDSVCQWIRIERNVWIPNVLTPNNDGFNDKFKILIKGHIEYDLVIYNRWGEKVFESDEFNYLWNGRKFNVKEDCTAGTYFYVFKYQLIGDQVKTRTGSITLLRK
ncbi:MAG: gliding motility-associated C-terminal domain-containing protein, partial [Bacteroidia bacterium]